MSAKLRGGLFILARTLPASNQFTQKGLTWKGPVQPPARHECPSAQAPCRALKDAYSALMVELSQGKQVGNGSSATAVFTIEPIIKVIISANTNFFMGKLLICFQLRSIPRRDKRQF
jgi:hypothetical protein